MALDADTRTAQPADRMGRQQVEVLAGKAIGVSGNGESGDPACAGVRCGAGEDGIDVCLRCVRYPDLLAV